MTMPFCPRSVAMPLVAAVLFFFADRGTRAETPQPSAVQPGSRVAIVGDSITEQKLYSRFVEGWLLACSGIPDVRVMQFGWGGETAGGFATRAENDLGVFKPDVVTLCYGMNDGGYQPWKEEIGRGYESNMRKVLDRLATLGVKRVVIGSPGAVDTNFFRPGQMMGDRPAHEAYNDTLAHLRDIDAALAKEKSQRFADVHAAMIDAMRRANETLGPKYDVCGPDGFHPGPNGQLLMAYAFLKGLGVDGRIGLINVDASAGTATATDGHTVKGVRKASGAVSVDLESRRWPFCFEGDAASSRGTRSIVPFVPFNDELNRLILEVPGLQAPRARVTWGGEMKEFTRDQLAAGINLAAEFARTPFDAPFTALQQAIADKQGFETFLIKQVVTNFRQIPGSADDPETKRATELLGSRLMTRWESLDKAVRDRLVPVQHAITIEPLGS